MVTDHPLKTYRESQNPPLSRPALARELGVDRLTVYRWEKGERKIGREKLPEVSEKTGIPKSELRPDLAELLKEVAE